MLSKRLIACLDVRDGRLAKSVRFVDTRDIGDPVAKAREYYEDGLDELVFYDITASSDRRRIMLDVVEKVAEQVFIPLSVGGGVRSVQDATDLRLAGAEKINVNSAAVERPELIAECAHAIGDQNVVLSMDVLRVPVSETISNRRSGSSDAATSCAPLANGAGQSCRLTAAPAAAGVSPAVAAEAPCSPGAGVPTEPPTGRPNRGPLFCCGKRRCTVCMCETPPICKLFPT